MRRCPLWRRVSSSSSSLSSSTLVYEQGQRMDGVREYFYYIDHQGQLFMDDARMKNFTSAFKEQKFLKFFFNRLRPNDTPRYVDQFPYVSRCGIEMNYVRCDDRPIVFTALNGDNLEIGNCSTLVTPLRPEGLCMLSNGRLYHPSEMDRYGLVKSKLADLLYPNFLFGSDGTPTHFRWRGEQFECTNEIRKYRS